MVSRFFNMKKASSLPILDLALDLYLERWERQSGCFFSNYSQNEQFHNPYCWILSLTVLKVLFSNKRRQMWPTLFTSREWSADIRRNISHAGIIIPYISHSNGVVSTVESEPGRVTVRSSLPRAVTSWTLPRVVTRPKTPTFWQQQRTTGINYPNGTSAMCWAVHIFFGDMVALQYGRLKRTDEVVHTYREGIHYCGPLGISGCPIDEAQQPLCKVGIKRKPVTPVSDCRITSLIQSGVWDFRVRVYCRAFVIGQQPDRG